MTLSSHAHGMCTHLLDVVVANQVRGAVDGSADLVRSGNAGEEVGDTGNAGDTLDGEGVENKASHVGSGHRSARDDVGGVSTADPGGLDVAARGEDVEDSAPVGEVGDSPLGIDGADGDGGLGRGRGEVGGVSSRVTSSDGRDNTGGRGSVDGSVEGGREATAKGQVHDGGVLAAVGDDVVSSPVEALENDGRGRGAALEDLDGQERGLLGDTIGGAADGASNVSAVADAVLLVAGEGSEGLGGTATEVVVGVVDARVNDVGVRVSTRGIIIDVAGSTRLTVGDGAETPGGRVLGDDGTLAHRGALGALDVVDLPDLVLLDDGDLC